MKSPNFSCRYRFCHPSVPILTVSLSWYSTSFSVNCWSASATNCAVGAMVHQGQRQAQPGMGERGGKRGLTGTEERGEWEVQQKGTVKERRREGGGRLGGWGVEGGGRLVPARAQGNERMGPTHPSRRPRQLPISAIVGPMWLAVLDASLYIKNRAVNGRQNCRSLLGGQTKCFQSAPFPPPVKFSPGGASNGQPCREALDPLPRMFPATFIAIRSTLFRT